MNGSGEDSNARLYLNAPASRRVWTSRKNPLYPLVRSPLAGGALALAATLALAAVGALGTDGLVRQLLLALPMAAALLAVYLYALDGRPFAEVASEGVTFRRRARGRTEHLEWGAVERVSVRARSVVLYRRARYAPVRLSLKNAPDRTARALRQRLADAADAHGIPVSS